MCGGKGGGGRPQVAGTQVVEQRSEFPDEIKPFITDILEKAQARFNQQTDAGYPIFPGGVEGRLAPMSAEQTEALEGYRQAGRSGIAGTGMSSARPYYEAGLSALGSSMGAFGPQQAQQYMNPYQQAVVDVAKREAVRQAQPTFRNIGDRAEQTGAFGGSRQAIAEAEANRNLQQQLGDIQTRGMQQAFEQGRAAFEQQKAREAAGAGRMFAQAPQAFRQGLAEMAALEGVGKTTRAEDQRKKNLLYEQFQEEQMYPTKSLAEYQSIVRGFPYQPSMYRTEQNLAPSPGLGQQLLGGLGTAASIYGGMGGFSKGGFGKVFGQEGGQVGGLASLASGGQLGLPSGIADVRMKQMLSVGLDPTDPNDVALIQSATSLADVQRIARDKKAKEKSNVLQADDQPGQKSLAEIEFIQKGGAGGGNTFKTGEAEKGINEAAALRGARTQGVDTFTEASGGISSLTPSKSTAAVTKGTKLTPINILQEKVKLLSGKVVDDQTKKYQGVRDNLLKNIFAKNPQEEIDRRIKGITDITDTYTGELDTLIKQGKDHTKTQAAKWDKYQKGRETAIENREREQMGDLLARGKKAKESGEQKAMSNFWGLMARAFSKGGQSTKGFVAGMLEGAEEGLNPFLDRLSDIQDQYSTGEEKRAREKMDIQDKRFNSLNDLADKSQAYLANLKDKEHKLLQDMTKEKAKVGASAEYKKLEAELSLNQKQIERAGLMTTVMDTSLAMRKAERDDARATIEVLTEWQDTITGTHGEEAGKAFSSNLTNLDKNIESAFGYTLGEGEDGAKIGMIGGQALKEDQAQALAKAKADVKRKFLSALTTGTHRDQMNAMETALAYIDSKYTGKKKVIEFDKKGKRIN